MGDSCLMHQSIINIIFHILLNYKLNNMVPGVEIVLNKILRMQTMEREGTQKSLQRATINVVVDKYLMGCTMNIYITLVNVLKDIST